MLYLIISWILIVFLVFYSFFGFLNFVDLKDYRLKNENTVSDNDNLSGLGEN